ASSSNSVLLAVGQPHLLRAYSITAHCIPRQTPKKGISFSRACVIAAILPSIPRSPKPGGTIMPAIPSSFSSILSLVKWSEWIHRRSEERRVGKECTDWWRGDRERKSDSQCVLA